MQAYEQIDVKNVDPFVIEVFEELNKVRANPSSYKKVVQEAEKQFSKELWKRPKNNVQLETNTGPKAVRDTVKWLNT